MNGAESGEQRSAVHERDHAQKREHNSQNDSDSDRQLDEDPKQVQAKKKNERAGDGRERCTVLAKKSADRTRRGAERDEDRRKSENESERRSEQSRARGLPLAQLLHANAREHRDVSGHERQDARRQKGNQPREKGP